MQATTNLLWAPAAWLPKADGAGQWVPHVLFKRDAQGAWQAILPGTLCPPDAQRLPGPVMPGVVNAHSHAFQRAFVGQAERREQGHDDFWSWRDRMYGVAARITPDELLPLATKLYRELLLGGYTHVCEFHYLHHQPDGSPHHPEATMALTLAQAAHDAGIGLTMLPVVYQRAGFAQPALRDDQRRFACDLDLALRLRDAIRALKRPQVQAGLAVHSLRAVPAATLHALHAATRSDAGPIHIHVAEQVSEVDDCLAHTGLRPVAWMAAQGLLDPRWSLVHATHVLPDEIDAVARQGAGVVLCPSTEANLGDGLTDVPRWLASATPLSIGSDSHVTRQWPEELRWLEYGQRLIRRQRNVCADPERGQPSTAARLVDRCLVGGAQAAGLGQGALGVLQVGARADLLVLNVDDPALAGVDQEHMLDALVFASVSRPFSAVMVAGQWAFAPRL